MRVELPKPSDGDTPAPPIHAIPDNPSRARPTPAWETWSTTLTRPRVALPLVAISIALFAWSLIIRRPVGAYYLKVSARAQSLANAPETNPPATAADVATLGDQVKALSRVMVSQRKEILPLLIALETNARQHGLRAERVMKPAQFFGGSLTNLELHPVVFRLQPAAEVAPGLYPRILEWLHAVPTLTQRAEVASLQILADVSGIESAEVKLHFFSLPAHEETAAK